MSAGDIPNFHEEGSAKSHEDVDGLEEPTVAQMMAAEARAPTHTALVNIVAQVAFYGSPQSMLLLSAITMSQIQSKRCLWSQYSGTVPVL